MNSTFLLTEQIIDKLYDLSILICKRKCVRINNIEIIGEQIQCIVDATDEKKNSIIFPFRIKMSELKKTT
jgi:hypothetical protein